MSDVLRSAELRLRHGLQLAGQAAQVGGGFAGVQGRLDLAGQGARGCGGSGARRRAAGSLRKPQGDPDLDEAQTADAAAWMGVVHNTLHDALLFSTLVDGQSDGASGSWSATRLLHRLSSPFGTAVSFSAR